MAPANKAAKDAVDFGFRFNAKFNGWCLPTTPELAAEDNDKPVHCGWDGCHSKYNDCAQALLKKLDDRYDRGLIAPEKLCKELKRLANKMKAALDNRQIWLNDADKNKGDSWNCPSYD